MRTFLLSVLLSCAVPVFAAPGLREWTARDGSKFKASFLGIQYDPEKLSLTIQLQDEQQQEKRIPLEHFSLADRAIFHQILNAPFVTTATIPLEPPKPPVIPKVRVVDNVELPMLQNEAAVKALFNKVISVNYDRVPIKKILDDLQAEHKFTIEFLPGPYEYGNQALLREEITLKREKMTFYEIFEEILKRKGMSYRYSQGYLQVGSSNEVQQFLELRAYKAADVLLITRNLKQQPEPSGSALQNQICELINPPSWQTNGGMGRIFYEERTGQLFVLNSLDAHLKIEDFLKKLRTKGLR
jgi:hypothetical protein